ncbi:MAG: Gfo/Idh/MocA family oxidoreductase, partial [Pirellulaceae bacterium]
MQRPTSRRSFLKSAGLGAAALGIASNTTANQQKIQGFEEEKAGSKTSKEWKPISDRKIRMGIVGYGVCKFGPQFSLQHHPNVDVVAVSDLFPDRCQALARECKCEKTYPSLEEMVKDDSIEAIFCATDA